MRAFGFRLMTMMLTLFALAGPVVAQDLGEGPHVALTLVAETQAPAAGSDVTLAFVAMPEKGWHGYWKNPGDAGIETKLGWTLPQGVTGGELAYPVPETLLIAGLMNYVYEGPYTELVTLKIPAGLAAGTRLPIAVRVDYLVCTEEVCVPESADLATELTVGTGAIDPARRAAFDGYRAAIPKPIGSLATYQSSAGQFRLAIPFPAAAAASDLYYFPLTDGAVDYAAPQAVSRDGDLITIETKARDGFTGPIEGVLRTGAGRGLLVKASAGSVAATAVGGGGGGVGFDWATAALALGGAILGGLILNIMPCVFPILSLKALSLAKAGTSEAQARADGLAYTAGVIAVCVALGALLLALRSAGATAGWAFQLQDPRVILVLLLLTTAIAFNLAGLFELSAPGFVNKMAANGSSGSFATGALAAFIATPCTGPFMGAALGAALILPWYVALAIFAGLGLGLALPFLLLGFIPALRRRLPKPGPWMNSFRHILSVPMFVTALALAWILGRQAGVDGMTLGLGAALIVALGLWLTGRRQARGLGLQWAPALGALVLGIGATALVSRAPAAAEATFASGSEAFSESRLATLRAENKPVFAYFTADWCLTCKVNEKAAIETTAVGSAFEKAGVATLVGDWTDGDADLGRFIEQHNRAGVPLYLYYAPGAAEPQVLPQLLTQDMLVKLAGATPTGVRS